LKDKISIKEKTVSNTPLPLKKNRLVAQVLYGKKIRENNTTDSKHQRNTQYQIEGTTQKMTI